MKKVVQHMTFRRLFSIILTLMLLAFEFYSIPHQAEVIEKEEIPIVYPAEEQSQDCHILTRQELSRLYSYKEDINTDTTIEFTIEEATLLMQVARSEGGDSLEGQLWVLGLIVNRLVDDNFPNSVYEIVSAPMQFEVFKTGVYKKADINVNSHLALAQIESGNNPTKGSLYFESSSNSSDSWHSQNREFVAEVAGNRFYR